MSKVPAPQDQVSATGRPYEVTIGASARIVDGMLKVADVESTHEAGVRFQILCDEPSSYGGRDLQPQPLHYMAAAVGFCLLTQLERFSQMFEIEITSAGCDVEIDWYRTGSVRAGTVRAGARACRVVVRLTSEADEEDLRNLVALAERGCFANQLVGAALPVEARYESNGRVMAG